MKYSCPGFRKKGFLGSGRVTKLPSPKLKSSSFHAFSFLVKTNATDPFPLDIIRTYVLLYRKSISAGEFMKQRTASGLSRFIIGQFMPLLFNRVDG